MPPKEGQIIIYVFVYSSFHTISARTLFLISHQRPSHLADERQDC